jgi:hypothetical protein
MIRFKINNVIFYEVQNFVRFKNIFKYLNTFYQEYNKIKWNISKEKEEFKFIENGEFVNENAKINKILESIHGIHHSGFLKINTKSKFKPHVGFFGIKFGILTFYISMKNPKSKCVFSCGQFEYEFTKKGQSIIFDDSFTNYFQNESDEDFVVFYINFRI